MLRSTLILPSPANKHKHTNATSLCLMTWCQAWTLSAVAPHGACCSDSVRAELSCSRPTSWTRQTPLETGARTPSHPERTFQCIAVHQALPLGGLDQSLNLLPQFVFLHPKYCLRTTTFSSSFPVGTQEPGSHFRVLFLEIS